MHLDQHSASHMERFCCCVSPLSVNIKLLRSINRQCMNTGIKIFLKIHIYMSSSQIRQEIRLGFATASFCNCNRFVLHWVRMPCQNRNTNNPCDHFGISLVSNVCISFV